jgi:hypothetical protein
MEINTKDENGKALTYWGGFKGKPMVNVDTKPSTVIFTEKDFKEMVNGWNEERDGLKKENEKLRETGGNIFLQGLLNRILKGQHEVIDSTNGLRCEVIDKSHIKQVFKDLAISEEEIKF